MARPKQPSTPEIRRLSNLSIPRRHLTDPRLGYRSSARASLKAKRMELNDRNKVPQPDAGPGSQAIEITAKRSDETLQESATRPAPQSDPHSPNREDSGNISIQQISSRLRHFLDPGRFSESPDRVSVTEIKPPPPLLPASGDRTAATTRGFALVRAKCPAESKPPAPRIPESRKVSLELLSARRP